MERLRAAIRRLSEALYQAARFLARQFVLLMEANARVFAAVNAGVVLCLERGWDHGPKRLPMGYRSGEQQMAWMSMSRHKAVHSNHATGVRAQPTMRFPFEYAGAKAPWTER